MDFSRNWIGQYVELPGDEELAAGLTEVGLAVEGAVERDSDVIFDVDVTTNRPDCMCHLGLAREVAVRFDRPLRTPEPQFEEASDRASEAVSVTLEDGEGCPRYVARVVRGVKVGPSPGWLRAALEAIGQRPINNIVDATNFVLWECGQPVHAFDLARVGGGEIVVRRARVGESLETLDGETRRLDPEVLVIADRERPVAVAGVMGGLDSEVSDGTGAVLIECAHFDPTVVRQGAGRLGMHTDASHRFERGADPEAPAAAANRVAALIVEVAGGSVSEGAVDVRSDRFPKPLTGTLDRRRLERFAGVEVTDRDVERILDGLGFELASIGDGRWQVTVPSWRYHDMRYTRTDGSVFEADLFEEVMRQLGFDRIPAALPPVQRPDEGRSEAYDRRQRVRRHLAASGLAEAINFGFHGAADDRRYGLGVEAPPIRLTNPLSELYDTMRRSLMVGLERSALFNIRRGAESVRLFETGHLFPGEGSAEVEAVALIEGGGGSVPWLRLQPVDWYDMKGRVEGLATRFGVALETRPAELPGVVDGTGGILERDGRPVGWLGELAIDDLPYPLFGAELELQALDGGDRFGGVRVPSRQPAIEVDLTLTHALEVPWRRIETAITAAATDELIAYGVKDRYRGEGVPDGAVNTTIYFVYNAGDRSLTQDEVNAQQTALTGRLESEFGWR